MEDTNSKLIIKDKYKRPGVIEEVSSRNSSEENELGSASSVGPSKGSQSARALKPKDGNGKAEENQEQFRIVISREANDSLEQCVAKANKGLEGGAVGRTDLAVYVFCNLSRFLTDTDYKALRALHFDEKKVLGSILKSEEELPEELRRALREHYGIGEPNKKRPLRTVPPVSTGDSVDDPSAA